MTGREEMLATCPFCGGTDSEDNACQMAAVETHAFRSPIGKTAYRVDCSCGASGAPDLVWSKARELWNTRPAAQRPADYGAWQPIETAPRDVRRSVLVVQPGKLAIRAYQSPVGTWHMHGDYQKTVLSGEYAPTHWMPLPAGPALPSTGREAPHD